MCCLTGVVCCLTCVVCCLTGVVCCLTGVVCCLTGDCSAQLPLQDVPGGGASVAHLSGSPRLLLEQVPPVDRHDPSVYPGGEGRVLTPSCEFLWFSTDRQ